MKRDTDFGGSADLCGSRCCPLHVCAGNADGGPESCTALFFTYAYLERNYKADQIKKMFIDIVMPGPDTK